MTGRRLPPREVRLATPGQLYVLNRAGRLQLVEGEPILNSQADQAIKQSMAQEASSKG